MSSHTNNDPMAKFSLVAASSLIALTVLILLNFLVNTISKNSVKGDLDKEAIIANHVALVEGNIAAIGEVATGDGAAAGASAGAGRSGEEVYKAVCGACHNTGAAGAPKLDDKANWEPRIAAGFDALMDSAINGKGAMPPRAGQNIADNELKAAIIHMAEAAGFDLGVSEDAAPQAATDAPAAPAAEATAQPATETAQAPETPAAPAAETSAETPAAPAPEVIPPAPVEIATPPAPDAQPSPAAPEAAQAPAAQPSPAAPEAAQAPASPTTPEPASAPESAAAPAAPPTHASIDGEAIYKQTCFVCHDMGVAGAPKTGDKSIWETRISKGAGTLYESAIKGIVAPAGVMPPKGGNMSLSDDEVRAAVDYMVLKAQ